MNLTVGGQSVPVVFAGPQGGYAGLDQVNAGPLPQSLRGRGEVPLVLSVEGKAVNRLVMEIR